MESNPRTTQPLPTAPAAAGARPLRSAERDYTYRALLLAFLVEVISCAGIFGDSFPRHAAEALVDYHVALNLPVYFLLYLFRVGPVLHVENGCLRLDNPISLAIIAAQCCVWTWLFAALMQVERRLRARLFR